MSLTHRFFFGIIVYFVAGMIIMRVKYEKTGSDIIPNKGFWMALPSLVKVNNKLNTHMHILSTYYVVYIQYF